MPELLASEKGVECAAFRYQLLVISYKLFCMVAMV